MNREEMLSLLRTHNCIVKFTKADGSERIMFCTLKQDEIPEDKKPKGSSSPSRKENLEIIKVFDTEIEEWRSFKVASVLDFRAVA